MRKTSCIKVEEHNEPHMKYIRVAKAVSLISKMPNKVGAITIKGGRICGAGCNGYPPKVDITEYNREAVVHAEMNAIQNSYVSINEIDAIYIYGLPPCNNCLKNIWNKIPAVYWFLNKQIPTCDKWVDDYNKFLYLMKGN